MGPETWPGRPYPLGATYDGIGTNFALFSEVADRVELCLFDDGHDRGAEQASGANGGGRPSAGERRIDMTEVDGYVWHFAPWARKGVAVVGGDDWTS